MTIVSILRLSSLIKFAKTQDMTCKEVQRLGKRRLIANTGDYVPVGYWSTVEVHVSVVCASLPALPSLFRKRRSAKIQSTLASRPYTRAGSELQNNAPDSVPLRVAGVHHQATSAGRIKVLSCINITSTVRPDDYASRVDASQWPSTINEIVGAVGGKSGVSGP